MVSISMYVILKSTWLVAVHSLLQKMHYTFHARRGKSERRSMLNIADVSDGFWKKKNLDIEHVGTEKNYADKLNLEYIWLCGGRVLQWRVSGESGPVYYMTLQFLSA